MRRRVLRVTGTVLIGAGVLGLIWVIVVWQWQDPFTGLYTTWQQHELRGQLNRIVARQEPLPRFAADASRRARLTAEKNWIAKEAAAFQRESHEGQAIGRIIIPRIGLKIVVVDGTDDSSLRRGPGLDLQTSMPGRDELVYIAGHRTTYLAPFSHIEKIVPGSIIRLEMPYATFVYRAYDHRIVRATDLGVLRPVGHELLRLQACHPRFFATHRYIVEAHLVSERPRGASALVVATGAVAGSHS
jgi:sortase A